MLLRFAYKLEWWNDGILEYWVSELHRIEKYHDS